MAQLEESIAALSREQIALASELKRLAQKRADVKNELAHLRERIVKEGAQLESYEDQLRTGRETRRQAVGRLSELGNMLRERRRVLRELEAQATKASSVDLEQELQRVERRIETQPLARHEEKKLVAYARDLAIRLKALRRVPQTKSELDTVDKELKKLRGNVKDLDAALSETGPQIMAARDRIRQLRAMARQLRSELAAVDDDGLELGQRYTETSSHLTELREKRRGFLDALRKAREQEEAQSRLLLLEKAREAIARKAEAGEKLSFEELRLLYGEEGDS